MNREIKFRGLRVDGGGWAFGDLIKSPFWDSKTGKACCYILDASKMDYDCWEDIAEQMEDFEVATESVGQFTGLKDKNGVEIFEGDILECEGVSYTMSQLPGKAIELRTDINDSMHFLFKNTEILKIIGNIHEK